MPKTTRRQPVASNPVTKDSTNPAISEALETVAQVFPTRISMPSWAESLSPRPISRTEILEHARAFDVVMGIPEFTTAPKPFFQRIFAAEKEIYIPNTSYVQRGVLYLTPSDMNFFMTARKTKDSTE
jgi:hypothetical protein